MKERVVLLGLDGGEPSLLVPLLAECANLRRLATEGAWGALRSTVPPLSPPAWATLLTGVNPGKHGVYDFYHMPFASSGSYVRRLIGSGHWRAPGLWQRTGAHGLRAGFVNLPMCWPPPAVQGFFVCGLGTPPGDGVAFTHPAALGPALAGAVLEPGDGTAIGDGRAFLARAERRRRHAAGGGGPLARRDARPLLRGAHLPRPLPALLLARAPGGRAGDPPRLAHVVRGLRRAPRAAPRRRRPRDDGRPLLRPRLRARRPLLPRQPLARPTRLAPRRRPVAPRHAGRAPHGDRLGADARVLRRRVRRRPAQPPRPRAARDRPPRRGGRG